MHAFVVDDSRVMRRLLGNLLSGAGYTLGEAGSGEEALRIVATAPPPALFLVDWNMPGMSGLDLVKALRADPRYHASRIVMVTTETAIGRMNEALGEGADEYLMKPFLREALLEKLRILGLPVVAPTPIGGA